MMHMSVMFLSDLLKTKLLNTITVVLEHFCSIHGAIMVNAPLSDGENTRLANLKPS